MNMDAYFPMAHDGCTGRHSSEARSDPMNILSLSPIYQDTLWNGHMTCSISRFTQYLDPWKYGQDTAEILDSCRSSGTVAVFAL
jgi:hypothetical protein